MKQRTDQTNDAMGTESTDAKSVCWRTSSQLPHNVRFENIGTSIGRKALLGLEIGGFVLAFSIAV